MQSESHSVLLSLAKVSLTIDDSSFFGMMWISRKQKQHTDGPTGVRGLLLVLVPHVQRHLRKQCLRTRTSTSMLSRWLRSKSDEMGFGPEPCEGGSGLPLEWGMEGGLRVHSSSVVYFCNIVHFCLARFWNGIDRQFYHPSPLSPLLRDSKPHTTR